MNRIWPPLITVICALVIKRFLPTVTVAIATAFCWLIVFLTGPLSKYWLSEWQEIAFVVLAQCVVLVGAKSEDRQERENFLNVSVSKNVVRTYYHELCILYRIVKLTYILTIY